MNTTNGFTANGSNTPHSKEDGQDGINVLFTVLFSISMFFALFGNLFVIFVVFRKRRMKTSTNVMLANLAVADLLVACTVMPFEIAFRNGAGHWVQGKFGDVSCKIFFFLTHTTISSSIVTLTLMALDRFLAIMFGLKHIRIFENAKITTGIIWITSMAIMVPIIPASEVTQRNGMIQCFRNFRLFGDTETAQKVFYWLVFFFLYLIPLLLMAIIYTIIIHKLWFQKVPGNIVDNNLRLAQARKRNVIRLLVIIVLVFAFCWFPAHVVHYYWTYHQRNLPSPMVINFNLWLSQANSAINPCLYIGLSSEFRKAFSQCMRKSVTQSIYRMSTRMTLGSVRRRNGIPPASKSIKKNNV